MKKAILLLLVVLGLTTTIFTSCEGDKDPYQYEYTIKKGNTKEEFITNLKGAYKEIYGKDFVYSLKMLNGDNTYRIISEPDGVIDFNFSNGQLASYTLVRNDNKRLDWIFNIMKGVEAVKAEY
ncbi:hypothetical protein [Sphingobacterium sp. 18053]|uniref:hypothetical protein n=1 Tax=Sphingobacterium sp. 18053 TaxID=2681401 RepID=UPI00135C2F91|nr:hypothetical protein [Sphingobacterium sp. 18053]